MLRIILMLCVLKALWARIILKYYMNAMLRIILIFMQRGYEIPFLLQSVTSKKMFRAIARHPLLFMHQPHDHVLRWFLYPTNITRLIKLTIPFILSGKIEIEFKLISGSNIHIILLLGMTIKGPMR